MNNDQKRLAYKAMYEGVLFPTNNFGNVIVEEYVNKREVLIKFINTGYKRTVNLKELLRGVIKDYSAPSVFEVGIIGEPNVKRDREYMLWVGVLERCYSSKKHLDRPTYKDCIVSDNFRYYTYFRDWCRDQIGFDQEGWQLDKDILFKGNKIYSEEYCVFVPRDVNILFTKTNALRGNYPIGVQYYKAGKCFRASVGRFGKSEYLGQFDTSEEAFNAYKQAKESYIKEVANKWKDQIDPRVYEALINYQVEITD